MLTETDGLERAIQIIQCTECPPAPDCERTPTRSRAFETGFNMARHMILQRLRAEQNERFRSRVEK